MNCVFERIFFIYKNKHKSNKIRRVVNKYESKMIRLHRKQENTAHFNGIKANPKTLFCLMIPEIYVCLFIYIYMCVCVEFVHLFNLFICLICLFVYLFKFCLFCFFCSVIGMKMNWKEQTETFECDQFNMKGEIFENELKEMN